MIRGYVLVFLGLASVFALVHYVATTASLYWYYSGLDSVMHVWGGGLLGLGIHTFFLYRKEKHVPSLGQVLLLLAVVTGAWELFEWRVGLWDPQVYIFETAKDIFLGFTGGLLAHFCLKTRYNKTT